MLLVLLDLMLFQLGFVLHQQVRLVLTQHTSMRVLEHTSVLLSALYGMQVVTLQQILLADTTLKLTSNTMFFLVHLELLQVSKLHTQ
jgi:hypothetical protein